MRDVRQYYNRATKRFLGYGHGRSELVIHRAIWGSGVESRTEAMHFAHELILSEIENGNFLRVVDLGCGVGGSIRYLARRCPAEYWGITISENQATEAESILLKELPDVSILLGDMVEINDRLPVTGKKTLFYAIESAIHLADISLLFESLGSSKSGDRIILIDDVLARSPIGSEERMLVRFKKGWHANGLATRKHIVDTAQRNGFVLDRQRDLSEHLELRRPRDRFIRVLIPILRLFGGRNSWMSSLIGGDALQRCLLTGLIAHLILVFRKI